MQPLISRTSAARLLGAALCAAALGLATSCGSSGADAPAASAPVTFSSAAGAGTAAQGSTGHGGHAAHSGHGGSGQTELELYAVQTASLGVVVTDGEGRVLYGSDGDGSNPPESHCTEACAQTWLPLTVPAGQEPQLLGVDAGAVGRVARQDGSSQLTVGGWPVYVNRNDDGQLKSPASGLQSAGWFAVSPSGTKVALPG